MASHFNELIESMEKMKETQRIQYDYFKHLTTLSTGSILIIVAYLEKIFDKPEAILLAIFSIGSFSLCLVGSLWALAPTSNIILYTTGLRTIITVGDKKKEDREKDAEDFTNKISKCLNCIHIFDYVTRYSFLGGIVLFIIFSIINFI